MPTTEIPPRSPVPPPQPAPRADGGDMYDAGHWELAYREMHDAPTLLIQLQDDLSRSRLREAFWISVVFHLTLVILIINSPKFEKYLPKRAVVVVSPNDWMRQKELTYLELPPDQQKVTKRPNTDKISDKDRIATSRTPQLNREELKKILASPRPGTPGAPMPQPTPPAPAVAENTPAPEQQPPPRAPSSQSQVAKLQAPPMGPRKPSFNTGSLSPGSAIAQAGQAAIANRGGYAGDGGDFGLGQGRQPAAVGALDILSDTRGVDFGPYLKHVVDEVRRNWYNIIPESARAPLMKKGKVSIQFFIMKNGTVQGMALVSTSGDTALDRGAWGGITASNPFPPLPPEFGGENLELRFHFFYNPERSDLQ